MAYILYYIYCGNYFLHLNILNYKSIYVLLILLIIQIGDTYSGIKNYKFGSQYPEIHKHKKNPFWIGLSKQFNEILLIER